MISIKEDVRELESIKNLNGLELLVDLLRSRVGSCIAVSNLAVDLQVAPQTINLWLQILEKMYVIFRVSTFTGKLARTLQKPCKFYFYDIADVDGDTGAKLENLVACALLARCNFLEDYEGFSMSLKYIRDKEGREVDFAILKEKKLHSLIEVKQSDKEPSKSLLYFGQRLSPSHGKYQILGQPIEKKLIKDVWIDYAPNLLKDMTFIS